MLPVALPCSTVLGTVVKKLNNKNPEANRSLPWWKHFSTNYSAGLTQWNSR